MPIFKAPRPIELILIAVFGLVTVAGVMGAFCGLAGTPREALRSSVQYTFLCLGPALASLGSILLLWVRNRYALEWKLAAAGLAAWCLGTVILSVGVAVIQVFGDPRHLVTDLGYSTALCLIPGGALTLLGLGAFGYGYRRRVQAAEQAQSANAPFEQLSRADKAQRAGDYHAGIAAALKRNESPVSKERHAALAAVLEDWRQHLRRLIERLDAFDADAVIQRDRRDVPAALARLSDQLERETAPEARADLLDAVNRYREQQAQLDELVSFMRRAEIGIDTTLAAMGTLYSQLQLLDAHGLQREAARLQADAQAQVNQLGDLISAMDEVYRAH